MHYRFYLMVGTMIMRGDHVACADDADASSQAERCLDDAQPTYDAIEVWHGTRLVCRHERRTT